MDQQRFAILGAVYAADDPLLQDVLDSTHSSPGRPRCLCVDGGVDMYVARHGQYVIKRMPDTGRLHHPSCPSFESDPSQSGLGELVGEAVIEVEPGRIELRVDFPWVRRVGRSGVSGNAGEAAEVTRPRRRMSLRALMHFLFERAGFNRWSPAMEGRRNQAVLHKYLMEAAAGVQVKGVPLHERLYVPEQFSEQRKAEDAQRRRTKLAILQPADGQWPLALVLGEYKGCDETAFGIRIWIRHMPDAPLLASARLWQRVERVFRPVFEAKDADSGVGVRLMLAALIRARREHTYEIESASLMLASEQWIPLEGLHELPLVAALVAQRRRFVKPLRYDARSASAFANAMLLDVGATALSLQVLSPFMNQADRTAKERAIAACGDEAWVWQTERAMPSFPATSAEAGKGAGSIRRLDDQQSGKPEPLLG